jgi:cytoskeletal protein RodZ
MELNIALRGKYGDLLTEKRIERGLTLKQLSINTGVSADILLAIETGKIKEFSVDDIKAYCRAVGVDESRVIYG